MDTHPDHFRMLRLAQLRQLQVKRLSPTVFAVSSYSRQGRWYRVTADTCECAAAVYCTHQARAVDFHLRRSPSPSERNEYTARLREDYTRLPYRKGLGRDDRRFLQECVDRVVEKYAHLFEQAELSEPVGCPF